MFSFSNNKKDINEINNMFENGKLIVDESYQRRSVWSEKDKVRLVETILLNYIIPELFFWKAETDPETGDSITHIVDGQQRIKAICSFITNEYKLKKSYLLSNEMKEKYGDKLFSELDSDTKKKFWNYKLMVIDIDQQVTRNDIIIMFNRLNLTDYSLNDQEKRNSKSGEFAILARELSDNPIWEKYSLFKSNDIKRMRDIEFCASIILLYRNGIIDQVNQAPLNEAYEELQTGYKDAEKDKQAFLNAINIIERFLQNKTTNSFLRRKSQLYTLFSVVFYAQRNNIKITDVQRNNLDVFIKLYSEFNNNMEIKEESSDEDKLLFDLLKRYKLASSEGLNKHTNRMIRYNIMKEVLFFSENKLDKLKASLLKKITKSKE